MITIRTFVWLALAMGATFGAEAAGPDDDPAAYRVRVPVVTAAGPQVQRLALPAEALAAAETADVTDVRIFDAANRVMPIARVAPAARPARRLKLAVMPIRGAADALNVTGVSLRIDADGQTRVARVEGVVPDGPATAVVLGVLLETRALAGNASGLALEVDVPGGQPVTFTVEASADLKTWRPVGEKVVYRPAASGGITATALIPFNGAELGGSDLRVTWRAGSRLLTAVAVRQATLLVRDDAAAGPSVAARLPSLTDRHAVDFMLPFRTPLDRIGIALTGDDVLVPVRVLGRDNPEQAWTVIGEGTAARAGGGRPALRDIALRGGTFRTMRIEADPRSAGFTALPMITLGFAPHEIVFVAAGREPFTLAAGRSGVTSAYLPLASLMAQSTGGTLPTATTPALPTRVQLQPVDVAGAAWRQALLWIVLLAATVLLGALAWILARQSRQEPRSGETAA